MQPLHAAHKSALSDVMLTYKRTQRLTVLKQRRHWVEGGRTCVCVCVCVSCQAGGEEGEGEAGDKEDGGWDMEDIDLPMDVIAEAATAGTASGPFVVPPPGQPASQKWLDRRTQVRGNG